MNTKSRSLTDFVTRFEVEDDYASCVDGRTVGGCEHEELWVPAEGAGDSDRRVVGAKRVV